MLIGLWEQENNNFKGNILKHLEIVRQYVYGGIIAFLYVFTLVAWLSYVKQFSPDHLEMFELIAYMVVGLMGIIGGVIFADYGLAIGLAGGGIFSIIAGSVRYWTKFQSLGKFAFGVSLLLVLLYFTFRILEKDDA